MAPNLTAHPDISIIIVIFHCKFLPNHWFIVYLVCFRCAPRVSQYSVYPPFFREPVFESDKIEDFFNSGEATKQAFVPVKAARNDQNSSVFYVPLTRYVSFL